MKNERILYQSADEEKTRYVATKTDGDFCRIYIYPGGELTTFNLEPKAIEETHEYINRLVATIVHLKEINREINYNIANLIAQVKHRSRVIEKLKEALARKTDIHESELNHIIVEAENVADLSGP